MSIVYFENEDSSSRVGIKPIKNTDIWELYKESLKVMWFTEEIELTTDISEWDSLDKNIKHFIKYVLSFFYSADKFVADNVCLNFVEEVNIMEAQFFYRSQAMVEDIHSDTYSTLVDALIPDDQEKNEVFNSLESMPVIRKKTDWICLLYTSPSPRD